MSDEKNSRGRDTDASKRDFKARRRLLKASAAAPLIATLSPSAALAQTSLTCAVKNADDSTLQGLPKVNEISNDQAVRVQGLCWTKNNKDDIWEVNGSSYSSAVDGDVPMDFPNGWSSHPCWFRQQFSVLTDGTVQHLGVYPEVENGTALSDSCWTSIAVSGQFDIGG